MARKWTLGLVLLWLGVLLITAGLTAAGGRAFGLAGGPAEGLIRLHVVANSDSEQDQALKRAVRDAILEQVSPLFASARSVEEARVAIHAAMPQIQAAAEAVVSAQGKQYQVGIALGQASFPGKSYGKLYLPAGEYEALKVQIGEAAGANWWCVLFPPLCFADWTSGVVLEPKPGTRGQETVSVPRRKAAALVDEEQLQRVPVKARFAVVEWVKTRSTGRR